MTPRIFGIEHILYLTVYLAVAIGCFIWVMQKNRSEQARTLFRQIVALVLLFCIVWNRISIVIHSHAAGYDETYNWWRLLPESFCGLNSLFFSILALCFKEDHPYLHHTAFVAIYGGALNTVYPTYLGQADSFLYPATISGMLHHSVSLLLAIYLIATGYIHPGIRKFPYFFFGMAAYVAWGTLLLALFPDFEHYDPMYLTAPLLPNTFLTWYVAGLLVFIVHAAVLACFSLFHKKKSAQP
ncbi:MAG: hypothetical protein J5993_02830 [Clostridia bacterium]|nr:hypothetical protein [Clostridia bacterium]